jgi:hypothetical protein
MLTCMLPLQFILAPEMGHRTLQLASYSYASPMSVVGKVASVHKHNFMVENYALYAFDHIYTSSYFEFVTPQSHIGKKREKAHIEWVIYKESHEC